MDLQQGYEAVDLGLRGNELGQNPAQPQRVLAQRRAHPLVAGGRGVALVEDEIDDLEHGRQARGELRPARDVERDARLAQGPLGPDDALRDGRLRHEERPRDLVGREPSQQPQRERHARLGREHWMAGDERGGLDPPDGIDRAVRIGLRHRLRSFCAIRALTSLRTSVAGRGLSTVKRMVPLEVSYDASALLYALVRAVLMKRLQWSLNAA